MDMLRLYARTLKVVEPIAEANQHKASFERTHWFATQYSLPMNARVRQKYSIARPLRKWCFCTGFFNFALNLSHSKPPEAL